MDIQCPYCEKELDICHDDGFGYEEGVKHQQQCGHCNKTFVFETSLLDRAMAALDDYLNAGDKSERALASIKAKALYKEFYDVEYRNKREGADNVSYRKSMPKDDSKKPFTTLLYYRL